MVSQLEKAHYFHNLHTSNEPLILVNSWDAGSAAACVRAGAKAVATSSWSMAAAQGYEDGECLPLADALKTVSRIIKTTDVPVTVDFEGGYTNDPNILAQNIEMLVSLGIVGLNFEDQIVGGDGLYEADEQADRLRIIRKTADASGVPIFINARTDVFLKPDARAKSDALITDVLRRANAYAEAGADGLFVPGLTDQSLIEFICARVSLPLNIMIDGDTVHPTAYANLGVSRVSFGPAPYLQMISLLESNAQRAFLSQ